MILVKVGELRNVLASSQLFWCRWSHKTKQTRIHEFRMKPQNWFFGVYGCVWFTVFRETIRFYRTPSCRQIVAVWRSKHSASITCFMRLSESKQLATSKSSNQPVLVLWRDANLLRMISRESPWNVITHIWHCATFARKLSKLQKSFRYLIDARRVSLKIATKQNLRSLKFDHVLNRLSWLRVKDAFTKFGLIRSRETEQKEEISLDVSRNLKVKFFKCGDTCCASWRASHLKFTYR